MNNQDGITLKGKLIISLNNKIVRETNNMVVTAGKEWVADRMSNASTVMTHMGIGTGSTTEALGDTDLDTAIGLRLGLTTSGGVVAGAVITYACHYPSGAHTGAIREAGIFTAATSGTMLARTVFSVVNKGALDSMTISWAVTIS